MPVGRKFIVHVLQFARGWVLFRDKRPVDSKVHKITEGRGPDREELNSAIANSDDDGWVYQRYLPLEDYDTSELITFVSKSTGAKIAIENLIPGLRDGAPSRRLADHLLGDQRLWHPRVWTEVTTGLQVDWLDQRQHQGAGDR